MNAEPIDLKALMQRQALLKAFPGEGASTPRVTNVRTDTPEYRSETAKEIERLTNNQRAADNATITLMKSGRFVVANKQNVTLAFDRYIKNFDTVVFPGGGKFTKYGDSRGVGDIVDALIADFKEDLNWDISKFAPARIILANLFWQGVREGWYPEQDAEQEDFDAAGEY